MLRQLTIILEKGCVSVATASGLVDSPVRRENRNRHGRSILALNCDHPRKQVDEFLVRLSTSVEVLRKQRQHREMMAEY